MQPKALGTVQLVTIALLAAYAAYQAHELRELRARTTDIEIRYAKVYDALSTLIVPTLDRHEKFVTASVEHAQTQEKLTDAIAKHLNVLSEPPRK